MQCKLMPMLILFVYVRISESVYHLKHLCKGYGECSILQVCIYIYIHIYICSQLYNYIYNIYILRNFAFIWSMLMANVREFVLDWM